MLSRKKFKEFMEEFKKFQISESHLNHVAREFSKEHINLFILDDVHNLVLNLLQEAMGDRENIITFFIYDLEWGKNGEECIKSFSGDYISLRTLDELYDYLYMESKVKTFVIADTHFNHTNIIKYCNRPYLNVNEMNEDIIKKWNSVVSPNDIVYHLGDFGFGTYNELKQIFERLNGRKYLILGNHDRRVGKQFYEDLGFIEVYKQCLLDNVLLSHKPCEIKGNECVNIYGHIHNSEIDDKFNDKKHFCVSVERVNYTPVELTTILEGKHDEEKI